MKKNKRIILVICFIPLIFILGVFSYLKLGGYFLINKADRKHIINEIENAPELPKHFYEIYSVMYPQSLEINSWRHTLNRELNSSYSLCPCRETAFENFYGLFVDATDMMLITSMLENSVTQIECLNFYINSQEKKAESLLDKEIENMNNEEIVELLLALENPSFYNKKRHPERVQNKVNEIINKLNNTP
ncbi:MAG: hypothetical protein E6767_06190 [Dysgonomonas sp.]|nr:hypothetical protein [Dysgonomonas sp.]